MTPEETGNWTRPNVKRVHRGRAISRPGRGFSEPELQQAGITMDRARRSEIHMDRRRRTVHPANVDLLRSLLKNGRAAAGDSHGSQE